MATVFWAVFVLGFRPRPRSILKAFVATLAYAAFLLGEPRPCAKL